MDGCIAENPFCYFHTNEFVVGVCALCLKERLLILAAKQASHSYSSKQQRQFRYFKRKATIPIPKVFALSSLLQLLDPRHPAKNDNSDDDEGSVASIEDSFLSMKFEENGNASWDNTNIIAKGSKEVHTRSLVEVHPKRDTTLRWRKRIGQLLLHLSRWKRSNKANPCNVGVVSKFDIGVKVSLTRRTTT